MPGSAPGCRMRTSSGKARWRLRRFDGSQENPMGKTVSFNRPDGKSVNAYLAEPAAGAKAPGIVVIQEWWGMNDQIRGVADRFAKAGYRALGPDLYRGKTPVYAQEANQPMTRANFGHS